MPHKDAAFALSEPDERARAVGAANTLWLDNGRAALDQHRRRRLHRRARRDARRAGTSGTDSAWCSAPAAPAAPLSMACSSAASRPIHVVNRTCRQGRSRSRALRRRGASGTLGGSAAAAEGRGAARQRHVARHERARTALTIDLAPMAPDAVVGDIVYVPLKTPLLAPPSSAGLRPPTASTCCCIRPCAASSSGSA